MATYDNVQWIYAARPEGVVTEDHYRRSQITVDDATLAADEVLVEVDYWSVDPYMRIQQSRFDTWEAPHPLGVVQRGATVGRVIAKGSEAGPAIGTVVSTYSGWQGYGVCKVDALTVLPPELQPVSYALGVLGMPGRTAFFGLRDAGRPKPKETLLVSGAAGAVGSIVGQIGKIMGCRVVGIAGSNAKVRHLTETLGFDAAINYKDHSEFKDMKAALQQACPDGIDVYFDNVGGMITDAAMMLINLRARVVICGQISQYSGGLDAPELGPRFLHRILYTRATIQGILARDYTPRIPEMLEVMTPWVNEGKIKYAETVIEGFERLPEALNMLFYGKNTGKLVVKRV